jgi:hypothetical protein
MGDIKILQSKLLELDIKIVGTPDGKFGRNTSKAILIFKKNYNRSKADVKTKKHYDDAGLVWPPSNLESSDVTPNITLAKDY